VGAGFAGLVAGYELVQAGHNVTILEASMRPGGRIYTVRDPFPDHLYAEWRDRFWRGLYGSSPLHSPV
jgi:monoamine oxidase